MKEKGKVGLSIHDAYDVTAHLVKDQSITTTNMSTLYIFRVKPKSITRLGRRSDDKIRPMKIVM